MLRAAAGLSLALALALTGCPSESPDDDDTTVAETDADGDGVSLEAGDCADDDSAVYPGAPEECDDVDSDCDGSLVDDFEDFDADEEPDCIDEDDDEDGDPDDTDCDDADASVYTGAAEIVDDGIDQDCNGHDTVSCFEDADGDGIGDATVTADDGDCDSAGESAVGGDCDDEDGDVYPDAPEDCDDTDSDCDGSLVDDFDDLDGDASPDCVDEDDDGDGDPDDSDCDDTDASVYAGAPETPDDGVDQDCDGFDGTSCFQDGDLDGAGGPTALFSVDDDCEDAGEAPTDADCDDTEPSVYPAAPELCDGLDNPCLSPPVLAPGSTPTGTSVTVTPQLVGNVLEVTTPVRLLSFSLELDPPAQSTAVTWEVYDTSGASPVLIASEAALLPDEGQGIYSSPSFGALELQPGTPYILGIDPGATSLTSYSTISPSLPITAPWGIFAGGATGASGAPGLFTLRSWNMTVTPWVETDGDGDGALGCEDCDDADPLVLPGATELCDALDNDCDGAVPGDEFDQDADGAAPCDGDCDDTDPALYPGAFELCDAVDSDCDGSLVDAFPDVDGDLVPDCGSVDDDGDGDTADTDCDDYDATIYTGAVETPDDGVDQDCNGFDGTACFEDLDGDGAGVAAIVSADDDCSDPGEGALGGDCDDTNPSMAPSLPETALNDCIDDVDQDCDSLVDGDDPECACAVARATVAGTLVTCPAGVASIGVAGDFEAATQTLTPVFDPNQGVACTPPLLFDVPADVRGFALASLGGAAPFWVNDTAVSNQAVPNSYPDNCTHGSDSRGCVFPGGTHTAVEPGCYAFSWFFAGVPAPSTLDLLTTTDRTTSGAERLDLHVVTTPTQQYSPAQIVDTLGRASAYLETAGVSVGTVTYGSISQFSVLAVEDRNDALALTTRTGASPRAATVVFVEELLGPTTGVAGGVPGRMGADGAGAGVLVETTGILPFELGRVLAHELGHFAGLAHSTEIAQTSSGGFTHDFVSDTPECEVAPIDHVNCAGLGAENMMFPYAGPHNVDFSPLQGDTLRAVVPGPAIPCTSATVAVDCTPDEICYSGSCVPGFGRLYTFGVSAASIQPLGPAGPWDPGGLPDPKVDFVVFGTSLGATNAVMDTLSPTWPVSGTARPASSDLDLIQYELLDEDPTGDELIDLYGAPGGYIPIEWLRDGTTTLTGTYSTLDIVYTPQ